jgi:hypothetical protein
MIGRILLLGCLGVALLGAGVVGGAWWWERGHAADHEFVFIIPKGTVISQANGSDTVRFPTRLTLTVGARDTLVIINDDVWPAQVGPFRLEPGQQMRQRFRGPGTYEVLCATMYHQGQLRITVNEGGLWQRTRALFR